MKVQKPFDSYRPGDVMSAEDVEDQRKRGNLDDLVRNGFVKAGDSPTLPAALDYSKLSKTELVELAKGQGVAGYSKLTKSALIEALEK